MEPLVYAFKSSAESKIHSVESELKELRASSSDLEAKVDAFIELLWSSASLKSSVISIDEVCDLLANARDPGKKIRAG
jgi:hypothetical protein